MNATVFTNRSKVDHLGSINFMKVINCMKICEFTFFTVESNYVAITVTNLSFTEKRSPTCNRTLEQLINTCPVESKVLPVHVHVITKAHADTAAPIFAWVRDIWTRKRIASFWTRIGLHIYNMPPEIILLCLIIIKCKMKDADNHFCIQDLPIATGAPHLHCTTWSWSRSRSGPRSGHNYGRSNRKYSLPFYHKS